ncbi:MAG: aminotransferase class I/II-fold pyridoxal phosphate-dependent enzyme [Crocinitomicaceae bacterium]|nr:aminotransferase class I/II-fold pyridoxal phosphate-dependent enzyme [Crocinitomicaceae bacterium]
MLNSKLPNVGTTIFTVMSKLANEHNAINLSQGFPNFKVDQQLIAIYKTILDSDTHQYAPMPGLPQLRYAIAEKVQHHYQRKLQAETEILITAGATQAIFTAITALVHDGEEVIILDPAYDCYDPAVQLAQGIAKHIAMEDDFSIDWQKVEDQITDKTKLIIINNPHNPSGTALKKADFDALTAIMENHPNLLLLSDEVYEYIYFEQPHISVNTLAKIRERSIITSSFGKTFHITGWKMGYIVAPENLLTEIKKVHQFNVFSVNSTAQHTLAAYLPQKDLSTLSGFYQEKRNLFRNLMAKSRFELLPCEGSYFQVASYKAISQEDDITFSKRLTTEFGVAVIPLSAFYEKPPKNNLVRFCFAKTDDTLIQAAEKLCKI